jgi:hypothetical protein
MLAQYLVHLLVAVHCNTVQILILLLLLLFSIAIRNQRRMKRKVNRNLHNKGVGIVVRN